MKYQLNALFSPAGDQPQAIEQLVKGLKAGLKYQTLLGVTGSGKTLTMAHVIKRYGVPTIILAPNKTLAAQLYGEMKRFFPQNAVEYFVSYYDYYQPEAYISSTDTFIEKDASINEQIEQLRLSATKALLERRDVIVVASVSAIYGLGDPQAYLSMVLHLRPQDPMNRTHLLQRLVELQYGRNDIDFKRGTFRVRGDQIDIRPADARELGLRVELYADRIESLALFDPVTGQILEWLERYTIYPKTHYATPKELLSKAAQTIGAELRERLQELRSQEKWIEAQRLEQRTLYDLEMLQELGYCSGVENYARHLSNRLPGEPPATLLDYLPADGLLFIDESHVTIPQIAGMYRGDRARKENLVLHGFRLPSAFDNRPLKFEEFELLAPQTIFVSATPGSYEQEHTQGEVVEQLIRPTGLVDPEIHVRPQSNQVEDLLSEILERKARNERVLITTLTKKMSEDLANYLSNYGLKVAYLHAEIGTIDRVEILHQLRIGTLDALIGVNLLREGLDLPEVSLVAILDADKEGFLRSTTSLIQTIGRAARHISGTAILYANKCTPAIRTTIAETTRRRNKQLAFNALHKLKPTPLNKPIEPMLVVGRTSKKHTTSISQAWEQINDIRTLELELMKASEALDFEKAILIRDRIDKLRMS